jgi:proton-dependent oligopeptide transporter, POT family
MADSVRDSRSSASGHAQRPGLPSRLTRRSTFYGGVPSAPSIEITPTTDGISESDLTSLRRTRDSIPLTVWLAALLGMFERFAYYGASAPFQNYMQNSIDDPSRPGVLGLGQAKATIINYAFITIGFLTPVPMAIVADKWTGRYWGILGSFA